MFTRMKNRIASMKDVALLLSTAEEVARADGLDQPAAEHMVIAALQHPDGRAATLLGAHGIDADTFATAVRRVHAAALDSDADGPMDGSLPATVEAGGLYRSAPSGQELIRQVAATAKGFDSAAIVREAVRAERGTVALAFRQLGIDDSDIA